MTVAVTINGHGITISERLKQHIDKKLGKLDRYLQEISDVRADLSVEKTARSADDRQVVQITVRSRGTILRAEERTHDMFAGVDVALEKLQRQIEKYKAKHRRGRGDGIDLGTLALQEQSDADGELLDDQQSVIARRKRFVVAPMTEIEAIEQMSLLGHNNFFIFYNADTAKINVLYVRKDGTFGLIEPQVG